MRALLPRLRLQGVALSSVFAMVGFPEQGPSNQDVLDAIGQTQAAVEQGFADVQAAIMAVQQSLSQVQSSLNFIVSNLQEIKASIDTIQASLMVKKKGAVRV